MTAGGRGAKRDAQRNGGRGAERNGGRGAERNGGRGAERNGGREAEHDGGREAERNAGLTAIERALGDLARASARRRVATVVLTFLVLGGLGLGMMRLEFRDDPFDALPTDNEHTQATQRFLDEFPGGSYASAVFFTVAPDKWEDANARLPNRLPYDRADPLDATLTGVLDSVVRDASAGQAGVGRGFPGPDNITDEVYMRAHEEFWQFIQPLVPTIRWDLTISSNVKLLNYTNTGIPNPVPGMEALRTPDPDAFTMPDRSPAGEAQYVAAWQSRYAASPATIASLISDDWRTIRNVYLFEPDGASLNDVGASLDAAVHAYRDALRTCDDTPADCELMWNVFQPDEVIVDPRSGTAAASHLTATTLHDVTILAPIVAALLLLAFFLAFRRISTVFVLAVPMLVAGIGVLGVFGIIGLPIHSVSLLVFPILMGNGIDFAFHMTSAYHEARVRGLEKLDAATEAGRAAGTPLFIATLTTLAGMMLLIFAPNRLLSQLGVAVLVGMTILLIVSLTTLPAALTWTRTAREASDTALGRGLERSARFWSRHRGLGAGLVGALVVAAMVPVMEGSDILVVGTPAAFFPADDPQRQDFETTNRVYFGGETDLVTNLLVLEGDFTTPAAQAFLADLEEAFRAKPYVLEESVTSIHFAMNSWIQVRQGTAGAPLVVAQESIQPGSSFPADQEGIKTLLDEMFATPLETYASFFVKHPTYDIGTLVVEMEQPSEFGPLEERWHDLLATIDEVAARHPDHGFDTHIAGATSVGYLFAAEEIPYLQVAAFVGLAMTGLLVLLIRRNVRDALIVASVVLVSGVWWAATLQLLDIPLSITLVGPVVMIAAIGSDYSLHMRYSLAHQGTRAWNIVGRAVFFSAATDIGAFLVFTQMRYGVLRDATVATAVALTCALAATLILVPIMSPRSENDETRSPA
jgi:predicted RND superfamily exporter protein